MSADIDKSNLDTILNDLAKQYRKYGGKYQKAELILVGGAAVIAKYNFRDSTKDIDAIIRSASALKDAAVIVGEKYNLEYKWLNSDFIKTTSYSEKLREYSKYYKTFANVLEVRVVDSEYLIAMKMMSAREYKKDLSDIVGIIEAHYKNGDIISREKIDKALTDIYGSNKDVPDSTWDFVDNALKCANDELYQSVRDKEIRSNKLLKDFEKEYTDVLTQDNVDDILKTLLEKDDRIVENNGSNVETTEEKEKRQKNRIVIDQSDDYEY